MSKSPWGNIGPWAAEAERVEEEQELTAKAEAAAARDGGGGGGGRDPQSFPLLKESVATTSKQTKKKTRATLTLQEFNMQNAYGSGSSTAHRGLTPEEMLRLPTSPKEHSAGDDSGGRIGGGFSSYGSRLGSGSGDEPRRSYGGFDDDRRRSSPRVSDSDQISRADEFTIGRP
ncbi:hypothetical protein OROHE_019518 [Orobanche hederae]